MNEKLNDTEKEDRDFEIALLYKSQKELAAAFNNVATAITNSSKNEDVVKAVESTAKEIKGFGKQLSELKINVSPPNVNVETNQEPVISQIKSLAEQGGRIEELLKAQNEYLKELCIPKEYDFVFKRNSYGTLESPIKAIPKMLIKSKYQA